MGKKTGYFALLLKISFFFSTLKGELASHERRRVDARAVS
jgi:hypothetical protein